MTDNEQVTWQRLSIRIGSAPPEEALFEGVPSHMRLATDRWINGEFGWNTAGGMQDQLMVRVATVLRISVEESYAMGGIRDQILSALHADDSLYLDCLDFLLHDGSSRPVGLRSVLRLAGSAWTVAESERELERRVNPEQLLAAEAATSADDDISAELQTAWQAAYGRKPDPSDAWDHAIKAVENLLIPIVIPNESKPNLGGVAGSLKSTHDRWTLGLRANGEFDEGQTVEALIRLIWPNPDRHGGEQQRGPTQREAELAVQVAIALVNLCRENLRRK